MLIRPGWEVNAYVNHSGIPFPGAGTYDHYVGFTNNGDNTTRYGGGRIFEATTNSFYPKTLPDLN